MYGSDPLRDRFKIKVDSLNDTDVCDLQDLIVSYVTADLYRGPAFELRLYMVDSRVIVPEKVMTLHPGPELARPENKLSSHFTLGSLAKGSVHVIVVLPDCTSNTCAR